MAVFQPLAEYRLLPQAYYELRSVFYGKTLQGRRRQLSRVEAAIANIERICDASRKIYVRNISPSSKLRSRRWSKIFSRVRHGSTPQLDNRDETQGKAKLKTCVRVGYPRNGRLCRARHSSRLSARECLGAGGMEYPLPGWQAK